LINVDTSEIGKHDRNLHLLSEIENSKNGSFKRLAHYLWSSVSVILINPLQ